MSCRSTPGNSALTSLARFGSGLSDMQTLSTFHALLREGTDLNAAAPTQAEFNNWLAQVRARIEQAPSYSYSYDERRRQSLLSRLAQLENSGLPNGATFYAWQNIEERCRKANQALTDQLAYYSQELNLDISQVQEQFNSWRKASDNNRALTSQTLPTSVAQLSTDYGGLLCQDN